MQIIIKTLQQKQFPLDIQPEDTVSSLKKRIEEIEKIDPVKQMIIYQGKILVDDSTIGAYNIKDNEFLVLMITKPKNTSPPKETTTTSTPSTEAPKPVAPIQIEATKPAVSSPAQEIASSATIDQSALVTGQAYEAAIVGLMEMGFERDLVIKALRASFNNPDRAAEYLFSGHIPNMLEEASPVTGTGSGSGNLEFLRNDPQFQQLRSLLHQNPQILQPLLQQIGIANPRLLQIINENQEEFISLLNEGLEEGGDEQDEEGGGEGGYEGHDEHQGIMDALGGNLEDVDPAQLEQIMAAAQAAPGGNPNPTPGAPLPTGIPQTQYIQVTPEEKDAIDRLEALGFERARVIEAFFACDKNESLAANYLFDNMHDEF